MSLEDLRKRLRASRRATRQPGERTAETRESEPAASEMTAASTGSSEGNLYGVGTAEQGATKDRSSQAYAGYQSATSVVPSPDRRGAASGARPDFQSVVEEARKRQEARVEPPANEGAEEEIASWEVREPRLCDALRALDPWQLAAVLDRHPSLLVRAQVGSGKTRVLVTRVLKELAGTADDGRPILVMTFTNRAALEIRERVLAASADPGRAGSRLRIGTFHGLCARLLRDELPDGEATPSRHFRLLHERARLQVLQGLIATHDLRIAYASKLERRLELLRGGQLRFGNMKRDDDIARLAELYEEAKRNRDEVDFDDLITLGRSRARELPPEKRPAAIIVDEFQDTDPEQLDLLDDWRADDTRLFAVGDPDQVIYSWRGGSSSVFSAFEERFQAETRTLPRNYRSTGTILEAARFLLGAAAGSHQLHAARESGEPLRILKHHDVVAEAKHIAMEVAELEGKSVAVLVRTREQMGPLAEHLENAGLKVRLRETRRHDDQLRDWFSSYLRLLQSGCSSEHLVPVLAHRNFGFEGLKGRRIELKPDESLELAALRWFRGRDQDAGVLLDLLGELAGLAERSFETVEEAIAAARLEFFLEARSSAYDTRVARIASWMRQLEKIEGPRWLEEVDDRLGLHADLVDDQLETEAIEIMTMHAAKGLEFDCVYLSGVNRGIVPLSASYGDGDQEAEERRLLFVAMTRARDQLQIGWFGTAVRRSAAPEPSAWLSLIPERLTTEDLQSRELAREPDGRFGAGVAVRHPRYGEGIVVAVEAGQVRCLFRTRGEKSFALAACPLVVV